MKEKRSREKDYLERQRDSLERQGEREKLLRGYLESERMIIQRDREY